MGFQAHRNAMLALNLNELRGLRLQLRKDAENESDPQRRAHRLSLSSAVTTMYRDLASWLPPEGRGVYGILTVAEYIEETGSESTRGAVNTAAFALISLEEATE